MMTLDQWKTLKDNQARRHIEWRDHARKDYRRKPMFKLHVALVLICVALVLAANALWKSLPW